MDLDLEPLVNSLDTFIGVLSIDGEIIFVNTAPLAAAGLLLDDLIGQIFWETAWFSGVESNRAYIRKHCELAATGVPTTGEVQVNLSGARIWVEFTVHPQFNDKNQVTHLIPEGRIIEEWKKSQSALAKINYDLELAIYNRTKELREANERLVELATTDYLTGLPNRRHAEEHIERIISQSHRTSTNMALMYIDIDSFKAINDTISHAARDAVLKTISDRFRAFYRKNEFMARLGGDEFCLIVPNFKNQQELSKTAQRLIETCAGTFGVDQQHITVGLSIGIAIFPENGTTYQHLSAAADAALYKVKNNGKGTFGFAD
ncbi:MAG: diguanylate cyclase [Pseudomonadales bacterium]|nr:diguanylate cyclase [Pseudomonadales bacterium]